MNGIDELQARFCDVGTDVAEAGLLLAKELDRLRGYGMYEALAGSMTTVARLAHYPPPRFQAEDQQPSSTQAFLELLPV